MECIEICGNSVSGVLSTEAAQTAQLVALIDSSQNHCERIEQIKWHRMYYTLYND